MEIDTLLRSLPDKVRQAFIYRQLDHLSYKDIAERLSVSVSSVEKYVAKALQVCMAGINQD
ncbi:Sigma factor, ECF subfamily [Nitrincola lacisaponensis]|uniref:Sigma factor, ECF subfamily n=2 Tax=Nitrincola lacisaponensis TaxID=267850 RepID=A0A063Y8Z4_9GAMM|nr:Sigma factor, ECF subfamily [Nitrincola lacisaponensis]